MRFLLSLCVALLLALPAARADDKEQVALTPQVVENYLNAHAALETLARDLAKQYGDRSDTEGDDPVASLPAYQEIPDAKSRTSAILSQYGFTDLDSLQLVASSVLLAYDYVDPANAPPDAAAEKEKAKADIEADTSLTPEKKQEQLQLLDQQYASVIQYKPLPGNVEAVRPYADRIKPIAEAN